MNGYYVLPSTEINVALYFNKEIKLELEHIKKLYLSHDPNGGFNLKLWPLSPKDLVQLIFKLSEWEIEDVVFENYQFYRNGVEELNKATKALSSIAIKSLKFINCINPQGLLFYVSHHKKWAINLRTIIIEKPILNNHNLELEELFPVWLIWNRRIRTIGYENIRDSPDSKKFERRRIDLIERNQRGYKLCQEACYTLLLIWKFRQSYLKLLADKNLLLKIVKSIWDSRYDTPEWFIDRVNKRNTWYDIIL